MRSRFAMVWVLAVVLALVAASCSSDGDDESTTTSSAQQETTTTEAAAEETTTTTSAEAAGVVCDEPVKVGVITDQSGALAIYGAHIMRAFPLGMEYATGNAGTDSYQLDDCTIEVLYKDDLSDAETSATIARELIEVDGVDILVGSVSSGVTAGIQELALQNDVIHIAAPAAANRGLRCGLPGHPRPRGAPHLLRAAELPGLRPRLAGRAVAGADRRARGHSRELILPRGENFGGIRPAPSRRASDRPNQAP